MLRSEPRDQGRPQASARHWLSNRPLPWKQSARSHVPHCSRASIDGLAQACSSARGLLRRKPSIPQSSMCVPPRAKHSAHGNGVERLISPRFGRSSPCGFHTRARHDSSEPEDLRMSAQYRIGGAQPERVKPDVPRSHGAPSVDDRRLVGGITPVIRNRLKWRGVRSYRNHVGRAKGLASHRRKSNLTRPAGNSVLVITSVNRNMTWP